MDDGHNIKGLKIELTQALENLPPAFAEAASRRQVAPLCPPGQPPAQRASWLGERPYGPAAKEG